MGRRGRGRGGGGGMFQITGDRNPGDEYASSGPKGGGGGGGGMGMGSRGGGGVGGGKKVNVSWMSQSAPSFIQKLRAQHGLLSREEAHKMSMEAKKAGPAPVTDEDLESRPVMDDEAPQVVVLKRGHVSLEEARDAAEKGDTGLDSVLGPALKKAKEETANEEGTSSKDGNNKVKAATKDEKRKKKKKKPVVEGAMSKKLNKLNKSMLSFGDDEGW